MKIYLDHGATTPVDNEVLKAMKPYFNEKYGNASSVHSFGDEAREALDKSRKVIADTINADPSEIIFTSGGTESNNFAIKEIAFDTKKRHIITTTFEHPAVKSVCKFLEEKLCFKITHLPVGNDGVVKIDDLKKAITEDTFLVTIMHANNEIGTINPIEEIGKICREKRIIFHTDAVQSFGKLNIDVKKMNIDLMSMSAHKIYGPKGIGALYVRKGIKLNPMFQGGSQEFKKRPGTENIPGIVGFAKAAEIANNRMEKDNEKMRELRDILIDGVLDTIPSSALNGSAEKRMTNNANIRFDYVEGESMLMHLNLKGIACSTGSACSSQSLQPSHVLKAIGLSDEQSHGSLRFTLGRQTTKKDINYLLKVLPPIIENLRKMSPLYKCR
ncbi:MAG: cysteine desulfurase NifS [Nanoarchaeota archaeon]|nr:cysteine desulfurase NifS [Nanoarchaeota archaeon]